MLLHIYFYCRTNWILNSLVKAMPYCLHNGSQNLRKLLQKMRIVTFSWHSVDIKALLVNVDADEQFQYNLPAGGLRKTTTRYTNRCILLPLNYQNFTSSGRPSVPGWRHSAVLSAELCLPLIRSCPPVQSHIIILHLHMWENNYCYSWIKHVTKWRRANLFHHKQQFSLCQHVWYPDCPWSLLHWEQMSIHCHRIDKCSIDPIASIMIVIYHKQQPRTLQNNATGWEQYIKNSRNHEQLKLLII